MLAPATAVDSTLTSLTRVLVVDEEPAILSFLKGQLVSEGFQLTLLDNAAKALETLRHQDFSVIIADHEMSSMTGLEFLSELRGTHPHVTRLLLTSSLSTKELLDAVSERRIDGFLTKPWLRDQLLMVLRNSIARKLSEAALNIDTAEGIADDIVPEIIPHDSRGVTPSRSGLDLASPQPGLAVEAFVKMLSTFHPTLGSIARRGMALSKTVAETLDLSEAEGNSLIWAAGLHDISMVGLDRALVRRWLRTPDGCDPDELDLIKKHPRESEEMLEPYAVFAQAGEIIRGHQEHWDGTGYPDRLKGEMIPWLSRILAVVIAYCTRYQTPVQVMNDIQTLSDKVFDPEAVAIVAKAAPFAELPRGEREILLRELQAGMVLARDIFNSGGVLVVAKGKELTTTWINKIHSINNVSPLNPYVLVYC